MTREYKPLSENQKKELYHLFEIHNNVGRVAELMGISDSTVERHLARTRKKSLREKDFTKIDLQWIVDLHEHHFNISEIARETGYSKPTVRNNLIRLGKYTPKPHPIKPDAEKLEQIRKSYIRHGRIEDVCAEVGLCHVTILKYLEKMGIPRGNNVTVDIDRIEQLHEYGLSNKQICQETGYSQPTITRYVRELHKRLEREKAEQ